MWSPLLTPGLTLLSGPRGDLRHFGQELAHFAVHAHPGTVLWVDGDHGFDPYAFAERNLEAGFAADDGADRLLVKRCMTAFNWDLALDKHLAEKLATTDVSLVLAAPYDRLFVHEELADWEQEDHLRFSLRHLADLARRFQVPILAPVDMARWWRTHPVLAQTTYERVDHRWTIDRPDGRWRAVDDRTGQAIDPWLRRQVTLLDYVDGVPAPAPTPTAPVLSSRSRPRRNALPVP